jgi:hypothetical protein
LAAGATDGFNVTVAGIDNADSIAWGVNFLPAGVAIKVYADATNSLRVDFVNGSSSSTGSTPLVLQITVFAALP